MQLEVYCSTRDESEGLDLGKHREKRSAVCLFYNERQKGRRTGWEERQRDNCNQNILCEKYVFSI